MESKVYVIRDWEKKFEISQSKRIPDGKPLSYVPMPTKHDGKGLRRLLRSEDALSMFGVWCLVVELAAKMPRRGVLADGDGPFDAEDIADSIGIEPEPVQCLLDLVTGGKINWIEFIEWSKDDHEPRTNGQCSENKRRSIRQQADEKRREEKRGEERTPPKPPKGVADDDDRWNVLCRVWGTGKIGPDRAPWESWFTWLRSVPEFDCGKHGDLLVTELVGMEGSKIGNPSSWFAAAMRRVVEGPRRYSGSGPDSDGPVDMEKLGWAG